MRAIFHFEFVVVVGDPPHAARTSRTSVIAATRGTPKVNIQTLLSGCSKPRSGNGHGLTSQTGDIVPDLTPQRAGSSMAIDVDGAPGATSPGEIFRWYAGTAESLAQDALSRW